MDAISSNNNNALGLTPEEEFAQRVRSLQDFFNIPAKSLEATQLVSSGSTLLTYEDRIRVMLKTGSNRLLVNLNELRAFRADAVKGVLQTPLEWVPAFERALSEEIQRLRESGEVFEPEQVDEKVRYHVGFEGAFGELHTSPRFLTSKYISHMVCLDGIVTSCSLVRPKLLKSVHYSETSGMFVFKTYTDATLVAPTDPKALGNNSYPTEDEHHRKLTSEFGLSTFRDYQTVTIQEMPEKAPPGQLPRSIDVILDDDLVDGVKPGDRVQVIGVYKAMSAVFNGVVNGTFRAVLIANNVRHLVGALGAPTELLSDTDVANVKVLGKRRDIFDLLSRSLAPSIYGHEMIKRAVLLMLLGGVERNLVNGTHLRGDINVLMVGDPSTAKSQMLRFVLGMAPLAIATTGRGSSGVGLTAAVVSDRETGERRLEAGAMVLADRGVVCIDEFDKMSDADRVAIHEVMEQQTVTIAKAGIHTTLNARCSVIAAANPIRGQYAPTESPQYNIGLPDSLLSRFDLLFIVLDQSDTEIDRRVATHVLKMHRHQNAGGAEDEDTPHGGDDVAGDERIFANDDHQEDDELGTLTIDFCKKYLRYAKVLQPVLTKTAAELIAEAYTEFRQKRELQEREADALEDAYANRYAANERSSANTFPVTARTLETLIRLASAHAKSRLSQRVEKRDARVAIELLNYCLWKEVLPKKKKNKRTKVTQQESDDDSSEGEEEGEEKETIEEDEKMPLSPRMSDLSLAASQAMEASSSQVAPLPSSNVFAAPSSSSQAAFAPAIVVDAERYQLYRKILIFV